MHKRFRILLAAAVVILSSIFALFPASPASAVDARLLPNNPALLDDNGNVRTGLIGRITCTRSGNNATVEYRSSDEITLQTASAPHGDQTCSQILRAIVSSIPNTTMDLALSAIDGLSYFSIEDGCTNNGCGVVNHDVGAGWTTPTPGEPTTPPPDVEDEEAPAPDCELGKLGWAICPLMNMVDSMLGGIYRWIEDNFLQINVEFYQTNGGTHQAWSTFRNLANILFVIFFLVVIFSQITSIGISNYGIKKMLPEIILAAILINLSFFIAQAMIDLSNIVGFQIKALLEGIANTLPGGLGEMTPGQGFLAGLSSILIGAGVVIGALAIGSVMMGGLGALFAAVALFLLSALIGVLILFLLLVVRQVGVIILVVLAPLAFAARILPNTQSLFKNWWKMFVALLVVYPACGLVIGAGKLAGKIIITAAEGIPEDEMVGVVASIFGPNAGLFAAVAARTMYLVVAMIAMIAPYFAVITIIKGSLKGLGALGGAITGKMTGAGKWGQNNLNKAPGLRNLQRQVDTGRAARSAQLKAKAEAANAKAAAKPNSAVSKMQKAEFAAAQAKDDAALASLGVYSGDNRSLLKTSRANAIRRGEYQAGNATFDYISNPANKALGLRNTVAHAAQNAKKGFAQAGRNIQGAALGAAQAIPGVNTEAARSRLGEKNVAAAGPNSYEAEQQAAAKTALQMEQRKYGEKIDANYAERGVNDVFDEVMDGTNIRAGANPIHVERAIKKMADKGEWGRAASISDAYMRSGIDRAGQRRLSEVLTKAPDIKDQAFQLHALGKQLEDNAETGTLTGGDISTGINSYLNSAAFRGKIDSGKYNGQLASMHGESAQMLAAADTSGDTRKAMLAQMNGQTIGGLGEQKFDMLFDGSNSFSSLGMSPNTAAEFQHIRDNYTEAGANAANWHYSGNLKTKVGV
ncbi:hypothetical protein FWG86_01750 [Candidatus Saccharibacteria bacterium]|nr:hypothetical protein [Candidatus Saccharibacteria bacterium]